MNNIVRIKNNECFPALNLGIAVTSAMDFFENSQFFFFFFSCDTSSVDWKNLYYRINIIPSRTRRMSIVVNTISQKRSHLMEGCSTGALRKFHAVSIIALLTTLMQPNPLFVESFTLPVGKTQFFTSKSQSVQYSFVRSM